MKTFDLDAFSVQEVNSNEMKTIEGGFLPLILTAWVVMGVCDAITVGLYIGYKNKK